MSTLANYTKTDWIDQEVQPTGTPDIDAGNLDKIENGIYDVTEAVQVLQDVTGPTPTDLLDDIKTVDGSGSGLDADFFRGAAPSAFLSSSSNVPSNLLPVEAIPSVQNAASQAAMLALTAQKGDWAIRTDANPDRYYMLNGTDPTILGNWQRMDSNEFATINSLTPTSGNLVLGATDLSPAAIAASEKDAISGVAALTSARLVAANRIAAGTEAAHKFVKGDGSGGTTWGTAPHICTSGTRPASPPEGMAIYETDTDNMYVNVGTSGSPVWRWIGTAFEVVFSDGRATLTTGAIPVRWQAPINLTIVGIRGSLYTPATGASLILDLNRATSGTPGTLTTIYSTTGNRPTFSASAYTSTTTLPNTVDIDAGDFLQVDLDQVGSTISGGGCSLQVRYVGRG